MKTTRPKLNIELTKADKLVENLGWLFLIVSWIIAIYSCFTLPEIIPIHFDIKGNANVFGNRLTILVMPFIGTAVISLLSVLNNYPEIFNYPKQITEENALENYTNATKMMRYLKLALAFVFSLVTLMEYITAQRSVPGLMFIVPVILGIIFLPIVFFIIKFFKIK